MSRGYMLLVSSQPVVLWLSGGGLTRSSMYHYPDPLRGRHYPLFLFEAVFGTNFGPAGGRARRVCRVNSGETAAGHVPEE